MKKIPQIYDYNDKLAVKDKLFTPQSGVKLNDGLFKTVFENNIEFLKLLDMGKMLYWFDEKTETPTESEPYRGHFEDNLKGSTLSMFLMGAANTLRWTDEEELQRLIKIGVDRIKSAVEPDGFLMPIKQSEFPSKEYPHYTRIWLTYALSAVGLSCDEGGYELLARWQDWFNSCVDLPVIKYLCLAFQGVVASPYVYINTPVGKSEDIEITIEHYEELWRLSQFMRKEKDCVHIRKQPGEEPHAHGSELEAIEGYLDLYRATARNYYLAAVIGAWELYHRDWEHPGGGIVMCEGMPTNYPGCYWLNPKNHYNELCCTSFWLYLNLRLHRLFPEEEKYMAEVEKSLYNIALANQDGGKGIRYFGYLDQKKQESGLVHCCCGVGTRIFGSLPEYVYSVSADTVSVNLYTPSEIDWESRFGRIKIKSDFDVTDSEDVKLTVYTERDTEFTLMLRIPSWAAEEAEIRINGEAITKGKPGSYTVIKRVFKDGDIVTYNLKQTLRLTKYKGADELTGFGRYYIEKGPILYAVSASDADSARLIGWSTDNFEDWLDPSEVKGVYSIKMHPDKKLVPYYMLDSDTPMTCCPIFT